MAGKMKLISELAGQTAREVTWDAGSWKRYLDTASRLYKYPFDDQLLIYAQRPDATACASMEVWNGHMRRWVKAGTKGIALIHKSEGGRPYLTYVFDVADTRPVRGARMPQLWEMRKEYHAPVLAALEMQYGRTGAGDFGERLMAVGANVAAAAYGEPFRDMDYDVQGDLPESADGGSLEACFRDTVTASVQYALLSRCGLKPEDYLKEDALCGITAFSTPDALHYLGDAISTLAKGILMEIGRAIRRYDRDKEKEAPEKTEKGVEKPDRSGYTIEKEQFNTLKCENAERSIQHGRTDLHEDGRLPDPGPGAGRGGRNGGGHAREVRAASGALPQGAAPRDVHGDASVWEAGGAPAPDRRAGAGAGRPDRGGADGAERRGRGAESARPDGMAHGGEQLHGAGGGDAAAGDRLPVREEDAGAEEENKKGQMAAGILPAVSASGNDDPAYFQLSLFPAMEEQAETPPARMDGLDQAVPKNVIARALTSGGNEKDSLLRIVACFGKSPSMADAAAFLREEYGTGGKGVSISGRDYALWFSGEGIRIAAGRRACVPGSTFVTWEKAAALTMRLLRDGAYATQELLDGAPENEYRELAGDLWGLRQNFSEEAEKKGFLPTLSELYAGMFPENTGKILEILHDREGRETLLRELVQFQAALRANPALLRFRLKVTPQGIGKRLADLDIQREKFRAGEGFRPVKGSFVTEDETDWLLTRGSGVSNGKMRIYSYFMQGHDAKECAAFLRKEYGDGGFGYTGYNEWHDSGGITFTRSDDFSGSGGYDTVKLNWNRVQKRIRGLIADGRYLNGKEQAYTATYEKLVLARKLYAFFYYDPRDKHKREWDIHAAERDYMPVLDMPKYSATLYEDMVEGLTLVSPEQGRIYRIMKDAVDAMGAFQRGEYSLFTPLPEEKLREERMKRESAKKKKEGANQAQEIKDAPAGELEAAARALAKKTRREVKEQADGQLSFDFTAFGTDGPEAVEHEPEIPSRKLQITGHRPEMAAYNSELPVHGPGVAVHKSELPVYGEEKAGYGLEAVQEPGQTAQEPGMPKQAREVAAQEIKTAVRHPEMPEHQLPRPASDISEREQPLKVTALEMEPAAGPHDADLEEAKHLIEAFLFQEYAVDEVDFSNPEHIGLAYANTPDGMHEIEAEANLFDASISQLVDGVCVDKRQYGSLRELTERELSVLDADALVRLDASVEDSLGLGESGESSERMQGAEPSVNQAETGAGQMPPAESATAATTRTAAVFSKGLPYEVVVEKLSVSPELHNYRITDDTPVPGGQKTRFQSNLAAVRTLKQIEAENRLATPGEQETLSKYAGWGSLAQAFDPDNARWEKEYTELKGLLTPAEYESARGTVLNAHYTSTTVIRAMYGAVSAMGFTPGNILEPSCGTGNFFGLVPEPYKDSRLYGVELDSLTGRIAKQLYQGADITVGGFETTEFPDDFFDLAIGNVPFGEYKVHDRRYGKQNLLIHDYFLIKTLDKVRPGGILAFITTKGTLDKANGKVREALAQKADLLGAVRLPNNAFRANAGTEVTTDILFFQKRGSAPERMPEWVTVGQTEEGVPLNSYFLAHPQMVLGRMAFWKNMYGNATETACLPSGGADLAAQLSEAMRQIAPPDQELLHMDVPGQEAGQGAESLPADPGVRNFSYTEKDGKLYFRENSRMVAAKPGKTQQARIRGMIGIRDSARRLIALQMDGAGDEAVGREQARLNALYDRFSRTHGLLNSAANRLAFRRDASYPLLCSLEVLDEEGNFRRKADMFTKRTIRHRQPVTSVDTAVEALGVSIGERGCVDLGFMASLMGGSGQIPRIVKDLKGIIFKEPESGRFDFAEGGTDWQKGWQTADAYLSGNVRRKLETARAAAEKYPEFAVNAEALSKVQPKELNAAEISVRIGAPWIDTDYYKQFLYETLQTPEKLRDGKSGLLYSDYSSEWRLTGRWDEDTTNARVWNTYGTKRADAYRLFELSLNQKSVQVFDYKTVDGEERRVLNEKETAVAQQKQDALKEAFRDWIFRDPDRRSDLCRTYNRLFNSTRPREYDGQHISFTGMNPEIRLEKHQRDAVARILYGGNTLLAHVVGAGKTYEMIAAAMESRRLGLCRKSMVVVPNHLTEQWGGDFLTLYPGANVLVATKKDFEPKNRKKFCARIATGDYDAVVIGHSQFERIPVSPDRQAATIRAQIDEVVNELVEAKARKEERFTIKQLERTKKSLEERISRLYSKKKDDTVYFEELGIDRLFVDEAQAFKNLYLHTKMRNVAGIGQTDAQKSSDMYAKCRYMDEITGGRGVVFATGTPISNSMTELYTMMRYLQHDMLEQGYRDSSGKIRSLKHFDNWAATFGEQVTAVELKPEGTGFRLKTRFARFYNLPELMNLWKEAADIQTADMLNLPVPQAEYVTVQTEPSAAQKRMVLALAERAEKIRKEKLDPRVDNMLKVTSDGRKLALDQRILDPLLPDDPGSKVNACVEQVFQIWQESMPQKGTQLIFSDLSTPKGRAQADAGSEKSSIPEALVDREKVLDGSETEKAGSEKTAVCESAPEKKDGQKTAGDQADGEKPPAGKTEVSVTAFNPAGEEPLMELSVYEDIRRKLVAKGIPTKEIAFIHEANTEVQKAELFAKVRSGQVRILLGSTQKMGAGTNVQTKLVASHDLDCPWRPADVGRILRTFKIKKNVEVTDNGKIII